MAGLKHLLFGSCLLAAALAAFPVGCGGGGSNDVANGQRPGNGGNGGNAGDASSSGGSGGGISLDADTASSVTVEPATASLEIVDGQIVTQGFTAYALYGSGNKQKIDPVWSISSPSVGSIDNTGLYTPSGNLGGQVTVTATYKSLSGSATLNVKLHFHDNAATADPSVQTLLTGATSPDTSCVWAYPYDKTVFPRGLLSQPLEWNGGNAGDIYYVHLSSPYFELESYTTAPPPAKYAFDETRWQQFTDSTTGAANLFVSRYDGTSATVVTQQDWTIAPQSMRGTIYYWANALGRVMRVKPGAATPDDFANQPPLNDPNSYPNQSSCLMTCHTVSADGSTIVSGGGTYGGSYNLLTSQPMHYTGGVWSGSETDWQSVQWSNAAVSPDGKYILTNTMAVGLGLTVSGPGGFEDLYDTSSGASVPNSGLQGKLTAMPSWSPTGSLVVYVDSGDPATWSQGWNVPNPGDLRAVDFDASANPMASNDRLLVATGADPNTRIVWPSVSPDGKWVLYGRSVGADTRTGNSDLYIASTSDPNSEVRLAALDGDGYPFAAGDRDRGWNFEPTFAPVASGGYFWVVFTSRRTFGNELTGAKDAVKQLWVAAIDQNPQPGVDPSHPPFILPGQDHGSINMRGFWALEPCKQDGQSCASGTECCGGYCEQDPDGGSYTCRPKTSGCSQNGDHCDTNADCCGAASGVTCINHVCSEAPPA